MRGMLRFVRLMKMAKQHPESTASMCEQIDYDCPLCPEYIEETPNFENEVVSRHQSNFKLLAALYLLLKVCPLVVHWQFLHD